MSGRRALFLDRDGVLNVDHGYVATAERLEIVDGAFAALRHAAALGYLLIVVTNQSGIARGLFTAAEYAAFEAHFTGRFAAEGVRFDAIYHCPHHPDGTVAAFRGTCECRKPAPGMILAAARDHDVDLAGSVMIGDKPSDAAAARAAGVGRIELVSEERGLADIVGSL